MIPLTTIIKIIPSALSRTGSALFSTARRSIEFVPDLTDGSRVVIPVSLGRYDTGQKKAAEYDNLLHRLFSSVVHLKQAELLSQVDVISTGGLQCINWEAEKVNRIEKHFLETHKELLEKVSRTYRWDEWIDEHRRDRFEADYDEIKEKTKEGSEWYILMVKTHEHAKMSSDLGKSLEYQRREYAAVKNMNDYDRLIYTGLISPAWAYMYHVFPYATLPLFTRASLEATPIVGAAEANQTTKLLISGLEQTLASPSFPETEKDRLIDVGLRLFYTYAPRSNGKERMKTEKKDASHIEKLTRK